MFVFLIFEVSGLLLPVREVEQSFQRDERSPARRAAGTTELTGSARCTTGQRGARTAPIPEQAPRKTSLEVEVTPIDRGPYDHLPETADISSTRSNVRQEERQHVRHYRSRKRREECKHRPQRQRQGMTLAWESVEVAQAGSPTVERDFFTTLFLSRVQEFG